MRLEGKTALITGASRNIGREVALTFAREGADLVLNTRSSQAELNPVPVPRFRCVACSRTCSRLPLCICPRRWYGWALQQLGLSLLLFGVSLRRTAAVTGLARHTVRRWWCWLQANSADFAFRLRSRFAALGRTTDTPAFWRACFADMPLCRAMAWLDHDGLTVP